MSSLSVGRIAEASRVIRPQFLHGPVQRSERLDLALGCALWLKDETRNPIRCFKGRGADYYLHLRPAPRLVCASAGNFALGMGHAAALRGSRLTAFVAEGANRDKIAKLVAAGVEVKVGGPDLEASQASARSFAASTGAVYVEDGIEPEISEGAGSIAVELLDEVSGLEAILVPLGGGALISGIARWVKHARPEIEVIGICAAGAPAMAQSWAAGRVVSTPSVSTAADGLAIRIPAAESVAEICANVDDVRMVTEERIGSAMRLLSGFGWQVEPSGAVGVAAILDQRQDFEGRNLATILTGANGLGESPAG